MFQKKFWHRKVLCLRGGGGEEYHDFPSKLLRLTVAKHSVEEAFSVSESFRYRKTLCIRAEHHDFLSKICCFTVPRNFVGEQICVLETSCYRRSFWIRGGSATIFRHKFSVSQSRKISLGNPSVCHLFRISKNFMLKRVMSKFSHKKQQKLFDRKLNFLIELYFSETSRLIRL